MQKHIKILDIFYGNRCNIACSHCDTHSDVIRDNEFDPELENIKESITLANNAFDVENWSVLGGEPLLYKNKIVKILDFLRNIEPNKTIFLSTNGLLLEKDIDWAVNIIKDYKVWMQVCNHVAAFKDKTKTENIIASVNTIGERLKFQKIEPAYLWWYKIMKYDTGTANWIEYVKKKNMDLSVRDPNDIVYMENNYGIHYMEAYNFQSIHQYTNGIPKPFNDNDPELSYKNSCPSQFCAFLYDKKVYKCAALGTLKNFLQKYNILNDLDWQPYLNYKPVDLTTYTQEDIKHFSNTHYCHIDECNMCPSKTIQIPQIEKNVLPIYKK